MTAKSQRKTTIARRDRATARGLARVEVQAARSDVNLFQALADALRTETEKAKALRSTLETALVDASVETAFDFFGSDLPDEAFAGIFDRRSQV